MLHPNSKHNDQYNFTELCKINPELNAFVTKNPRDEDTIDFFNPEAVKALNKSLLQCFYKVGYWDIPKGFLCPPVPGRADYIHNLNDLLKDSPCKTDTRKILDIGVGANCIYPIIGAAEYNWDFVGSDIDKKSIASAEKIAEKNPFLKEKLELRLQSDSDKIFENIVGKDEYFDACICNPPFHATKNAADKAAERKLRNLNSNVQGNENPVLNFAGRNNELYCDGGEEKFLLDMIYQSRDYADNFHWFTSLVSKEENLNKMERPLRRCKVMQAEIIDLRHGNKSSRILAWTYK